MDREREAEITATSMKPTTPTKETHVWIDLEIRVGE